jgi:hypothetical protein
MLPTLRTATGVLVAALTLASRLDAQSPAEGPGQELGVALGFAYGGTRDEALSPRRYVGSGAALEASYVRHSSRGSIGLTLGGLTFGSARSGDGTSSLDGGSGEGRLEVPWRTASLKQDRLLLFAGGTVSAQLSGREHVHHDASGSPIAFRGRALTTIMSLQGVAAWRLVVSPRATLSQRIALAVGGIVGRPYAIDQVAVQYGVRTVGPGDLHQIDNVFGLDRELSSRLTLLVRYRTELLRTRDALPVADVRQSLSLGLARQLGRPKP